MKSAFEKGVNSSITEQKHHAFRPVNGSTSYIKPSYDASAAANLRRSARTNVKSSKRKNKNASSFQHSDSHPDKSSNSSINDGDEDESSKLEINPHKKKLVFLSKRVYEKAREHKVTNGTEIAREILEESRQLKMNFDFKNVQRRVYDALNVLTALDMIKKDRNKIEFIRDVDEVFGGEVKQEVSSPEIKTENDINYTVQRLREMKVKKLQQLQAKKQYFDEITVQVSLLKRLVRRNLKAENEDATTNNTPGKKKHDHVSMEKYQQTRKIQLPMLVVEFKNKAALEILMNEEHNK